MAEQFDESPYTPDELAILRTGEVTEIPAAQADQSLAMIYRKAAAFDALVDIAKSMGEVRIGYSLSCWAAYWYDDSCLLSSDDRNKINMELIEDECPMSAVEALYRKLKEPTDG